MHASKYHRQAVEGEQAKVQLLGLLILVQQYFLQAALPDRQSA